MPTIFNKAVYSAYCAVLRNSKLVFHSAHSLPDIFIWEEKVVPWLF